MTGGQRDPFATPGRLLVQGGRVVDPSQDLDAPLDVLIEDGVVTRLGEGLSPQDLGLSDDEILDASGLVVSPGLIDLRTHLREPGEEHRETIDSGTRAAAAGGYTAVAAMPRTRPVNDNRSVTEYLLKEAERRGWARVWPVGAVSKGCEGEELAEMGEMRRAGAVAFSDDDRPVEHPELVRRALLYSQHFGVVVILHGEDRALSGDGVVHEGPWSTRLGLPGIPGASEEIGVARDLILHREVGGRCHVSHVSTAAALELVRWAKKEGGGRGGPEVSAGRPGRVTCEVAPHHLFLTDEEVAKQGFSTATKVRPPLRPEDDRRALLEGLTDGTVDAIASDHSPHHPDEKDVQLSAAPFGVVGLEITASLCLDRLVAAGVIGLPRLVELLSTGPARVLGVPGGSLAPGSPGDLTLIDLERRVTVVPADFHSKGRSTPFLGWELVGGPVGTVVGGRRVRPDGV